MQSDPTSNFHNLVKALQRVLDSFKTPERLTDFELGQRDGLLWAVQIAAEIDEKTSPDD